MKEKHSVIQTLKQNTPHLFILAEKMTNSNKNVKKKHFILPLNNNEKATKAIEFNGFVLIW